MLWFARVIIPMIPLGMIVALLYLARQLGELDFRQDDDLVIAVAEEVGMIDPLLGLNGVERQIEALVFDRLFRPDEHLVLQENLAESWRYHQRLVFFFVDTKSAEKAEGQMVSRFATEKEMGVDQRLTKVWRDDLSLTVLLPAYGENSGGTLLDSLTEAKPLPVLKVRLYLKGAVKESWADFKRSSAEKGQIKREWIEQGQEVVFFIAGDVDLFLKELRLYYESNQNLEPKIEILAQTSFLDVPEWVVTLRSDVAWHDGEPFTSQDVLFSYERLMRSATELGLREKFDHVESMRVVGTHQFVVECRDYYAPIAESWEQLPILPSHLLAGEKGAVEWGKFVRNPIGTGAFVFAERKKNEGVYLNHNKNYFAGKVRQETMKFPLIKAANERVRGMRTALFDGLWASASDRSLKQGDDRLQMVEGAYRKQTLVVWNLARPLFQELKVRQALASFVDAESLLDLKAGTAQQLCRGIFYPEAWYCKKSMEPVHLDYEKGGGLLDAAGWEREHLTWENSLGEKLAFTLLVDSDSQEHMELATALVEQWKKSGVLVELLPMSWLELVTEHLQTRDFDAALVSWDLDMGRDQYRVWHSSESKRGGGNIFSLRNGPVDRILQALKTQKNPVEVKALALSLQEKIAHLQPCLFLLEEADCVIFKKDTIIMARPMGKGQSSDEKLGEGSSSLQSEWKWWWRKNNK